MTQCHHRGMAEALADKFMGLNPICWTSKDTDTIVDKINDIARRQNDNHSVFTNWSPAYGAGTMLVFVLERSRHQFEDDQKLFGAVRLIFGK